MRENGENVHKHLHNYMDMVNKIASIAINLNIHDMYEYGFLSFYDGFIIALNMP